MPGNFARGFFEAKLNQQTELVSRVSRVENNSIIQIHHDSIIGASSGQTVEARVIHDVPNPTEDYNVYLSDVTSLDGINIETNNGPTTVIRIINPNSHTVALKCHDAYTGNQSPTAQMLSDPLIRGALPAAGDFNNLIIVQKTSNQDILCQLYQTSTGTKAWALINS